MGMSEDDCNQGLHCGVFGLYSSTLCLGSLLLYFNFTTIIIFLFFGPHLVLFKAHFWLLDLIYGAGDQTQASCFFSLHWNTVAGKVSRAQFKCDHTTVWLGGLEVEQKGGCCISPVYVTAFPISH